MTKRPSLAAFAALSAALLLGPPALASATVQWSTASANPTLVTTDLPAPTRNISYNRHVQAPQDASNPWKACGDVAFETTWATDDPVLTIQVAQGTPRLSVVGQDGQRFVLVKPDRGFYCANDGIVNVTSPGAGTWLVHTYERRKKSIAGTPAGRPDHTFQLSDSTRPLRLAGLEKRTVRLDRSTMAPMRLTVRWASKRSVAVATNRCRGYTLPVRPDALVQLGPGSFDGWLDGPVGTRLFAAPLNGVTIPNPKCGNSGTRVHLRGGKARSWALWVAPKEDREGGVPSAQDVTISITHPGMRNAASLAPRPASLTSDVNARVLQTHYPYLKVAIPSRQGPRRALAEKLWAQSDPRLWVFAKPNVRGLESDEPVILVRWGRQRLGAVTFDGTILRVRPNDVRPRPVKAPTFGTTVLAMPEDRRRNAASTKRFVEPKLHRLVDKLYAARERYHACYEKAFAKSDNTGSAYRKQLVTRRNGRVVKVENWGRKIAAKADRKCKGKRLQKLEDKATKAFDASYARLESARLKQRAQELLKRRAELARQNRPTRL